MYISVGAWMSFNCKKGEFDRCFNRLDRPVEESRPDQFPSLLHIIALHPKYTMPQRWQGVGNTEFDLTSQEIEI